MRIDHFLCQIPLKYYPTIKLLTRIPREVDLYLDFGIVAKEELVY